jgi:hypothetical protein
MTEEKRELETADTDPVPTESPLYRHNCSRCVFLGTTEFDGANYDLYYCAQGHLFPTIIARGSSDPHNYASGMALAAIDPVLREAYERSKQRGYIPVDNDPSDENSD